MVVKHNCVYNVELELKQLSADSPRLHDASCTCSWITIAASVHVFWSFVGFSAHMAKLFIM